MKLRRFKVIKEYPTSPKIGVIYKQSTQFPRYYDLENNNGFYAPSSMQTDIVEKFPEYFEELTPIDTKIESENKVAYVEYKNTIWERKTFNMNEVSDEIIKEDCNCVIIN